MKTIILLLLAPLLLFSKEATVEQLFSVQTVKVKESVASHSKNSYGYVKADDSRVYHVAPRFGGYVVKLNADKMYKFVKKGDALATLYSPEVYKAKEDYLNSYNYSRGKESNGMLRSAKLKLELLGVNPSEIKEVLQNKKVSQNTTMLSPITGYVFVKNVSIGSAFSAKTKLFEIVNLDEVWVEAKVFDEDLRWLKNVENFKVTVKSTEKTYETSSSLLYPNLDMKEATLTLRLQLKNSDNKLFPGMYANILSQDKEENYLTLPSNAVMRKNGKFYVFMVGDFKGEYEPREISVKPLNSDEYVIKNGLNAGDEVVSNALFMLDSDAQINGLY